MLDVITVGETMGVFAPKSSGRLRYCNDFNLNIAGAESNFSIGLQKLGHSTGWISKLGNDELGELIQYKLRGEGIDLSNVTIDEDRPTGLMIKEFTSSTETKISYYRDNSAASNISINDIDVSYIGNAKLIHLTGITPLLSNSNKEMIEFIIQYAKKNNILVSFDPNIRQKLLKGRDELFTLRSLIDQADIVLLGVEEAQLLYDTNNEQKIKNILFSNKNRKYLALKDGSNGSWVSDNNQIIKIAPFGCTPVDSTGAGDAYNAGFISGILMDKSIHECGKIASICGALATETYGDYEGFPSMTEVLNILYDQVTYYR